MESSGGYCPHKKSLLETQTGLFGSGRRRAIAGLCTKFVFCLFFVCFLLGCGVVCEEGVLVVYV